MSKGKGSDGWRNTGDSHWTGWGIANDKVIDRRTGRPWSWWTIDRKAAHKRDEKRARQAKQQQQSRKSSWWN